MAAVAGRADVAHVTENATAAVAAAATVGVLVVEIVQMVAIVIVGRVEVVSGSDVALVLRGVYDGLVFTGSCAGSRRAVRGRGHVAGGLHTAAVHSW